MALHYRVDNANKSVLSYTSRVTTPSICYKLNGRTYYVPLLENGTSTTIGDYTYSVSGKTICCRYNNKTYKSATNRTAVNYDIPAGTYSPSAFRTLIESYLSTGSSRTVRFGFTVIVNNQSIYVYENDTIYYNQVSSGDNQARLVGFRYNGKDMGGRYHLVINFTTYKQYCVWCNHLGTPSIYQTYENYPITIQNGGIKFN